MNIYMRLAWRNLWRHRRRTLIVVVAIGFGLALMMFYDGLITGFNQAIYGNAIKVLGGNIQIHASGYDNEKGQTPLLPLADDQAVLKTVQAQPQVVSATRRINTGGLASNRKGAFAVGIVAIEPDQEQSLSLIAQHVVDGRFLATEDKDVIFIGKGLAAAMEVKVGDRITLAGRALHNQMRSRTMTIAGIYDVGMSDIEKRSIYMTLGEAQDLYGLDGKSTEVVVNLKEIGEEPAVMNAIQPGLPAYEMSSWQTNYPELEAAINGKSGVMNVFSVIILVVAGIGILNLLLMAIYERTREIGLLGALGMKPRQISMLFLLEGGLMGLVGVAFGVALGLLINIWLGQVGIDYSQFSSMTSYTALINGSIYPSLGVENLLQRVVTVIVISVLAALYPAQSAAQNEPAKALHYV